MIVSWIACDCQRWAVPVGLVLAASRAPDLRQLLCKIRARRDDLLILQPKELPPIASQQRILRCKPIYRGRF